MLYNPNSVLTPRFALHELNLSYRDIQDVYISHFHADHVGGLEWLAFTTKFDPNCKKKINLHLRDIMVKDLWNHVLRGGLCSLEVVQAKLSTYFDVKSIKANGSFLWEGINFYIVQTIHAMSGFMIMPSYGLIFEINGMKILLTTDSQFNPAQIMKFYEEADIIFQDCETSSGKSGVHAHYTELTTLDQRIRKKMWLYHYNPGSLPNAVKDGFRGFIKKGQIFDFSDPQTL